VLAYHASAPFARGGFLGVDVFFVVSGFLITELMLRDADAHDGRISLTEFYARRARRILPAAGVVIVATLVGVSLLDNAFERVQAARDALAATLFYANVHFVPASGFFGPHQSLFAQFWSLSLEEQFYAIWPLLFLTLCVVARRRRRVLAAAVLAVCTASFVQALVWASHTDGLSLDPARAFQLLPSRAWELGVGALLAITAPRVSKLAARVQTPLLVGGLAAIAFVLVSYHDPARFPSTSALLATFGTAAVIASGLEREGAGWVSRLLASPLPQAIGRYSYELYLWHFPVLLLVALRGHHSWRVNAAIMMGIAAPAAVLTYHLVENPVRNARVLRRSPARSLALGAAIVTVAVIANAVVNVEGRSKLHTNLRAAAAVIDPTAPAVAGTKFVPSNLSPGLDDPHPWEYVRPGKSCRARCTVATTEGSRSIVLFGDSHAEHFIPGLEGAIGPLGASFVDRTQSACRLFEPAGAPTPDYCPAFIDATIAELAASPPSVIVLSTAGLAEIDHLGGEYSSLVSETIRRLPATSTIVVASFTPRATDDTRSCLADHLTSADSCDLPWPVEPNAQLAAAAQAAGATFLDLRPVLCMDTTCPPIIGNQLVWTDTQHLTPEFSATLGPWFAQQLRPLLPA
jgi:peptidoglycan/LPS O-acetylase OafA/YrhL